LIDPDERERQVVSLLESWPSRTPGVLVGGYAVAAYGTPRYSVDVDIVVSISSRDAWTNWLTAHRMERQRTHRVSRTGESLIEVQRWEYDTITLDLMIGGVQDRESGGVIPESWLLRDPSAVRLELLSGPLAKPIRVVRLEGLWAMKLLAGRPHDLTDLFSVMNQKVDLTEVRDFFSESLQSSSWRKLRGVLAQVAGTKLYVDALSRLRQGSPDLRANLVRWNRFTEMVVGAMPRDTSGGKPLS
jgi:Nucleotidyl transferase AbiEii toxin, Type IV TA system